MVYLLQMVRGCLLANGLMLRRDVKRDCGILGTQSVALRSDDLAIQ